MSGIMKLYCYYIIVTTIVIIPIIVIIMILIIIITHMRRPAAQRFTEAMGRPKCLAMSKAVLDSLWV